MVIFLHGTDSYRQQERLSFLREAFIDKYDEKGFNVHTVDGETFSIDDFRKHTKSAGLFAEKRFITLRNLWKLVKEEQEQLGDELESIDQDTILCIIGDTPPRKDNKLFKVLLKADTVEEFQELTAAQLRSFIKKECKGHNAEIDEDAVDHLASSIGNDLWRLTSEVKRLANYTKHITSAIVTELVDEIIDDNIFNLTDALGQKNTSQASSLLSQQFEAGANEQYLITMLARHIATLLKVKKTDGVGLKMHPFVMQKAQKQVAQFSQKQLLLLYWRLLNIDHSLKTTNKDARTLLDLFIVEACQ